MRVDGRRERGDRSRARILAASLAIASKEGLEAITIGGVATAAGVPKSSVQVLFGSRLNLQRETLRRGAEEFEAEISEAIRPSSSPLGRLRAMIAAWFSVLERKGAVGGCLVTAAAAEFRLREGLLSDAVQEHRARWRAALTTQIAEAITQGELRKHVDPDDLAFEIMAYQLAANSAFAADGPDDLLRARRRAMGRLAELGTV